ncbi:hypothetical protein [Lentzea xinjiangensis]|uniref:hypothetical protein n=1 Tax=Lentzea xinjiangensis TaxID=402600 RepID=UPI001C432F7F|nr:hypothetical protein [Lentzea xinjiangensis]
MASSGWLYWALVSGGHEPVAMLPERQAHSSPLTGENESPHSHHSLRSWALTTTGVSMPPFTTPAV